MQGRLAYEWFCQKCGAKINGKSDNDDLLRFNKTNLYPIILGFIFLLIAILFASRLVLVLCLFAAGFLFEFKSDNAFLNSILVAVIPGILFIITMQNIYYLFIDEYRKSTSGRTFVLNKY